MKNTNEKRENRKNEWIQKLKNYLWNSRFQKL